MTGPSPGFDRPETFSLALDFRVFSRRFVPLLVLLVVVVTVALGLALRVAVGAIGWLIAAAVAVPLTAALYAVKKRQFRTNIAPATLVISPAGVVLTDRYTRTELAWPAIRTIGQANLMSGLQLGFNDSQAHTAAQDAINLATNAGRAMSDSLIGPGSFQVNPAAPAWFRTQVQQNRMLESEKAISLANFDMNWRTGRIGQWIHVYRPDLLARN